MKSLTLILSISSGILLAPLAFLSVTTGYCMKTPWLTGLLTLGILGDYGICSEIHATLTPELLSLVGVVHVVTTVELLGERYSKVSKVVWLLLRVYRIIAWILVAIVTSITITHLILIP